jgi:simple sugar transport system permease protein
MVAGEGKQTVAATRLGGIDALVALLSRYREASIAVVAILIVIYFQTRNSVFLTSQELSVILRDTGRIGLISAAITFVMITGEIDLSVGATFALAPYSMSLIASTWNIPLWLGGLLAIALGILIGFINGFISVRLRVPSLITTLGTFFLLSGITVTIAQSEPITTPVQEPFNIIFGENLYGPADSVWSWNGLSGFTPFLWPVLIVLILTVVLTQTRFGLHIVATGSNIVGAREIGVRIERVKIYTFMILGALTAFSGIIYAVQFGSTQPDVGSSNLTLQAIAAAVIGGTSLTGGSGTTIGALIGAFVVATLNNGLVLIGAQATQSDIYLGAAIVAAMLLNIRVNDVRQRGRL